jgi:sporulation protein YlmC with PRC-barrel domain
LLFTEDRVLPVELVKNATDQVIELWVDKGDLEQVPRFEEVHYVVSDEEQLAKGHVNAAPSLLYVRPYGYQSPVPHGPRPQETGLDERVERNIPEDTIALKEGADVIDVSGEQIGQVEEVLTDPKLKRATHFVISKGLLLPQEKMVPLDWIQKINEEFVELAVSTKVIERMPGREVE